MLLNVIENAVAHTSALLELLTNPAHDPHQQWRRVVNHPDYCDQLQRTASLLVRKYRLPQDWQGDIEQDAILILHRSIQRRTNLGFDPGKCNGRVLGWLRVVIRSHCLQAVRRLRSRQRRYQTLDFQAWQLPDRCVPDLQRALWSAIETLPPAAQRLTRAYLEGGTVQAAADALGLSWSTARRALKRHLCLLKRSLCT
ncbi:MAG TPA: sigma-70 family RNA polymerase sigma factor [Pirellulales bacterium]|nr:sigma-70 family RNA polymerase sigma factor [Pirellulales bacterium]